MFNNPDEARVALPIPNDLAPLEVVNLKAIAGRSNLPQSVVQKTLGSLSQKHVIFSDKTATLQKYPNLAFEHCALCSPLDQRPWNVNRDIVKWLIS